MGFLLLVIIRFLIAFNGMCYSRVRNANLIRIPSDFDTHNFIYIIRSIMEVEYYVDHRFTSMALSAYTLSRTPRKVENWQNKLIDKYN